MEGLSKDIWLKNADYELNEFLKQRENALKRIFNKRIKQSFLIEILHRVEEKWDIISSYFNMNFDNISMISGTGDYIHYEICRMIVGIHRSNCIFLKDDERRNKEKDESYKKELVVEVVNNIKLRSFSAVFFRKKSIIQGDEFAFFPLIYRLFVIVVKSLDDLCKDYPTVHLQQFFVNIFNKSLAALSLIEDNLLEDAYPICRLIIELYFKLLLIEVNPELLDAHEKFSDYDFKKSCYGIDYPEEFEKSFKERKYKNDRSKINFLHYGWLDSLEDYHSVVKNSHYSITGIIEYLEIKNYYQMDFKWLKALYKMCHSYTHGNVYQSRYPLLHYFELGILLFYTLNHTYLILCEHTKANKNVGDIDVLALLNNDVLKTIEQYKNSNEENFKLYYKK